MAEDIYGTDLELFNSDLVISTDGDLDLITGTDNVNQSLQNAFLTPYYYWGGSYRHGSRLQEFIEAGGISVDRSDLKRAIAEVLRADTRIINDSWKIAISIIREQILITMTYLPLGRLTPEVQTFLLE